jgi:anti-sigma regulatory factor (Ser/Thr protein kinase)
MVTIRKSTEEIRHFILSNVQEHPIDIVKFTAEHFGMSRQSINKHIRALVAQADIIAEGNTSSRTYKLGEGRMAYMVFDITADLEEHVIWSRKIRPLLEDLPENILELWGYSFQEILNNAIEHSEGSKVEIVVQKNDEQTEIIIKDNGRGIFKKLCNEYGFDDEKHAALELSKGKLTTDPNSHTGQGIFFSSRMVDSFIIESGRASLFHLPNKVFDFVLESGQEEKCGTIIIMKLGNNASRTITSVFDMFELPGDEDHGFVKTLIPVKLAQYDKEMMVSRSQARRVLARVNRFKHVGLDFQGVDKIGQPFADEIFRVFFLEYPDITIYCLNENDQIKRAIKKAIADANDINR